MRHAFDKIIVVSLGGSIVNPGKVDARFIRAFRSLVKKFARRGKKFVLVVGGGKLCRVVQSEAGKVGKLSDDENDRLGIYVTRVNAQVVKSAFGNMADPVLVEHPDAMQKLKKPVTVAGGSRPGQSTDHVTVYLAKQLGAREAIIAGKPSHVYSKNPDKFKNAKALSFLSWREYEKLIPRKWTPGLNAPVDPVAARFAKQNGISAIVINGKDLKNFARLLNGEEFKGTIVR